MRIFKTTLLLFILTGFAFGQEHSFDTIFVNNKSSFEIKIKKEKNLSLLTSTLKGKITVIDTIEIEALSYVKYPDFDKDGNKDILLDYYGNNSSYHLYLFDKAINKFIKIKNYISFPDAVQLKSNSKYYYSYQRAGCADNNWVSNLFKIENFKIVHLGNIEGIGCDFELKENPQIIEIFKVPKNNSRNKKLVEKLQYLKYIKKFDEKWSFIENYWNKNYSKFE